MENESSAVETIGAPSVKALFIYPIKACRGISVGSAFLSNTGFKWDRMWMVVNSKGRMLTQRVNPELALVEVSLPEEALYMPRDSLSPDSALIVRAPGMDPLRVPLLAATSCVMVEASVWTWAGATLDEGNDAAKWFTSYLGEPCKLVRFDTESQIRPTNPDYACGFKICFPDGYPFLVISQASLDSLNEKLGSPVSINRFRPNILVQGCEPFAEDFWQTFMLAGLTFHGVKLCSRCKVTTVNQETAEVSGEPLTMLGSFRAGKMMSLTQSKAKIFFGQNAVCEECADIGHNELKSIKVGDTLAILKRWPAITESLV